MAIIFKREKNERGVPAGSLKLGDTFLYDNRVGLVVDRNGHQFFLDLTTACEMHYKADFPYGPTLGENTIVVPITIEMHYKVAG